MKKLKFLLVICLAGLLTGCYKFDAKMTIDKDKKVNFEIIYGMMNMGEVEEETLTTTSAPEVIATEENNTEEVTTIGANEEDLTTIGEGTDSIDLSDAKINCTDLQAALGDTFKVEAWNDDTYAGCKISKTYENIDDISGDKEVIIELTNVANGEFDDKQLFTKNGDKYSAHFRFTATTEDDSVDLSQMKEYFKLSYSVELPYKNLSNNATKVEDGGKKLTWEIQPDKVTEIKYSFNFTGKGEIPWLYIGIGVGALVVIIVVVIICKGKKCNCKCECNEAKAEEVTEQPTVSEPVQEVTEVNEENTNNENNQ